MMRITKRATIRKTTDLYYITVSVIITNLPDPRSHPINMVDDEDGE